ncbi:Bug family tripartite tricarboxylate transporter substrate binding protein [Reyranella sp.]|uniref:Bug family tripartite tricarboxylate transporter substrate binding protein n=1 Tax=Reyranella sp. TaxID=1929291 RepID=UPI003784CD3D
MSLLTRRALAAGLAALPFANIHAQEVDFPDRPLRFVVGFPPGGPNDLLARVVAPGIGERLKRSVVVENRAGANGEIAAASVAKAPADGSVFMLASNGSTTVAAALNRNLPYDARTDFAAVAPVGINPMLLVVRNDLPARDVAELLALARAQPGKLNGASAGAGGATHLALELFKALGKVDIVHVPYKGGGPAMADLMAGLVDVYFGGLSTALPHVKAGKMRALGQTSTTRSAAAPDIPTIAEAGLPGYEAAISYGIFLPAGAAPSLVRRLHAAVDATIRSPDVARKFSELGADPQFGTPTEFAAYVAADLEKWAALARQAGLKVE